jgi:hypothetical protein
VKLTRARRRGRVEVYFDPVMEEKIRKVRSQNQKQTDPKLKTRSTP